MHTHTPLTTLALLIILVLPAPAAASGNMNPTDKYAWSESGGWSNLGPSGAGVTVYPDHLEGFAWAENFGWMKLGSHTGGGVHSYTNSTSADWGVNLAGSQLSGYAWSEAAGWINFRPTGGGVVFDADSGLLDGYAWGENLGWIHFMGMANNYAVRLNRVNLAVSLMGSGSGSVHSIPGGISCDITGGCGSDFFQSWPVTLAAVPNWKSVFAGFSGDSTVATFSMDSDKTVIATFAANYRAKLLPNTPYASIQDAYDNAADGNEIRAQAYYFQEPNGLVIKKATAASVIIRGGYKPDDANYDTVTGVTSVNGPVRIQNGKLIVYRLSIR